jgi:hypothetical protein
MKKIVPISLVTALIFVVAVFYKNFVLFSLSNDHPWMLKAFLALGLDPDKEIEGERLIGHAIGWSGRGSRSIQVLIDHGADINQQNQYGSFLAKSITYGRLEVARLLVARGITMRGLWLAAYNSNDEALIVSSIPDNLDLLNYCKDYVSYRDQLKDTWPGIFSAFNLKCTFND